jgi:hypothetical protein
MADIIYLSSSKGSAGKQAFEKTARDLVAAFGYGSRPVSRQVLSFRLPV